MSHRREKQIFLEALERHDSQRDAYLLAECGDDDGLRLSVESLLSAHERSNALFDESLDPGEQLQRQVQLAAEVFGVSTPGYSIGDRGRDSFDRTGETIQHFRLMEKLGEGGFGQVYVAQQQHPVRRNVAIKLLKPGMDSKEVLARFEAERQALALMNHPNIAQVYDAGATSQGQPFIVMELVRGVPITTFCTQKRVPTRERLELFVDVCKAVHHAHRKGVIHRDLKPSNVLVTLHETVPVVKVIDFGVAKALNEPLTDKTIYTRFAQLIGTPMYMSPEQAEMKALDVDTRSDIYSLGVLLYELLTDITPFDQTRMQSASFDEMRRMIREEEPPRPSARLSTARACDAETRSDQAAETRELASRLRGDLDWVVMKALDKDRRRRYDTAADLSRDIERYLNSEPVLARPPSQWYRFTKFAHRNKLALAASLLVLLSMIAGTAVSTWQAVRARQAQAEAESLRKEAVDFAKRLKDANILLVSARANADQGRWPQAYDEYTRATELSPDHFLTWAGRGSLLANLGAWRTSAADYAQAIELGTPANNPAWWGVPQLCSYAGQRDAYESICRLLQQQVNESDDPALVTIAARSICLQPIESERASKLADRLEELLSRTPRSAPFPFRGPGDFPPPRPPAGGFEGGFPPFGIPRELIAYSTSLAQYRAGHFKRAVELLEPIANGRGRPIPGSVQLVTPLLALAYHRLGEHEKARELLAEAIEANANWINGVSTQSNPFPWFDGLESHILLQEASQVISPGQPLDDTPLEQLEQQALALLQH